MTASDDEQGGLEQVAAADRNPALTGMRAVAALSVLGTHAAYGTGALNRGAYARMGNNQMLVADVRTRETKRFLTAPNGAEVTGCVMSPDGRSLFVNIQHPGEPAGDRSNPDAPLAVSRWPDGHGRPRSATLVIRREDGGLIGS